MNKKPQNNESISNKLSPDLLNMVCGTDVKIKTNEPNPDKIITIAPEDQQCAPGIDFSDGSCLSLKSLIAMANAFNIDSQKNNSVSIVMYPEFQTLNPGKYKKYLLRQFSKIYKDCKSQHCWTEQDFMQYIEPETEREILKHTFVPPGPQGQFTWLNTNDINQKMEQYHRACPDFRFLGAMPIDFDEINGNPLRYLSVQELMHQGVYKIGVIFNLDTSKEPGSHWVALYSDLQKGCIYFSDSYGVAPDQRIVKFMRRLAKQLKQLHGRAPIVKHNEIRQQYGYSECGVYSLNFIIRLLKGVPYESLISKPLPDKLVNICRTVYFIPENDENNVSDDYSNSNSGNYN